MKGGQILFNVCSGVLILILGGVLWAQSNDLERLRSELADLQVRKAAPPNQRPKESSPKREKGHAEDTPKARAEAAVFERIRTSDNPSDEDLIEGLKAADPEAQEVVRSLVRDEQKAMREERRERRMERRMERQQEELEALKVSAGLSDTETESIDMYLTEERDLMSTIRSEAREQRNWSEAREKSESLRAETDQKVADVLSEEQYAEYTKMREEQMPGFMRGGRRGGRGGSDR